MLLKDCNPFVRFAEIQSAILEHTGLRKAYDYRLFYVLENNGRILIENRYFPICPDTLIVIPPNTAYDFQGKLKVCILNFDVSRRYAHRAEPLFPPCVTEFDPNLLFETELLDEFDHPVILNENIFTRETILQIVRQFNTHGKYADAIVSAKLKLLLSELLSSRMINEEKLAEKIMTYINTNAASIHSNEDIAQALGYHSVYLGTIIKQVTGQTLHKVIVDAKIQLACQWLTGTNEEIEQISYLVGFCSRTHFCTVFKKTKGVTASEYRRRSLLD